MAETQTWDVLSPDPEAVGALVAALGVSPLVATLLANRKLTDPGEAAAFLSPQLKSMPDPFLMKGMEAAVTRIVDAISARESICVWGDYDVDGVTSASQLIWFFRALDVPVRSFVPDRFTEGYGLNAERLVELAVGGVQLFITVDCGISNAREVAIAKEHGADVIVVDHHKVPPVVPDAVAVLDPHQADCPYPDKHLAACGVTWVLLVALRARLRELGAFAARPEPDLREWLDLTAIGTVADMVPLLGLNRVITQYGLGLVGHSTRPGVKALREVSGLGGDRPITAGSVGFQLGPRINAAGRMAHASAGVELMTTEDTAAAAMSAAGVDAYNLERRAVQDEIFEEAVAIVGELGERRALVLAKEGWHSGVLGIVASKLVERFNRPTILLSIEGGVAKGSARSAGGFKLVDHLTLLEGMLLKYGGHDYAAGLTLDAAQVDAFTAAFEAEARAFLSDDRLVRRLRIDAELPLERVDLALIEDIRRLAPHGQGNPSPVFVARDVLVHDVRLVGDDKRHVKLRLAAGHHGLDAIAFGLASEAPAPGARVDVAYVPETNEWRGEVRLQALVRAIRPTLVPDADRTIAPSAVELAFD